MKNETLCARMQCEELVLHETSLKTSIKKRELQASLKDQKEQAKSLGGRRKKKNLHRSKV